MSNHQSTFKERLSWYFYDFAISAFSTTVVTVFIGPYLTGIAVNAADSYGFISILGIPIKSGSFFPYVVSLSVLLQVFLLPLVGAISDFTNQKKLILGIFSYLGAFSTLLMYFLEGTNYLFGGLLFLIANLSFGSAMVVYNSYLNQIASPNQRDSVSSAGWAFGYLGGGLLLAANLALVSSAESLGLTISNAVRICLASAGLWWGLFTLPPLLFLKSNKSTASIQNGKNLLTIGWTTLWETLKSARKYPRTLYFLIAYLLYNDGVQAVIVLSAQFGQEELGLDIATLTTVILIVQFVAFFGAWIFNFAAKSIGTKRALLLSIVIWTGAIFYSYLYLNDTTGFYILGAVIGLVLGGTQALSRSLFSQFIPIGKEAEYYGLFEISDRGTSWLGPLLFGLSLQFSESYRIAILSLAVFFILGFILLMKVDVNKTIHDVHGTKIS